MWFFLVLILENYLFHALLIIVTSFTLRSLCWMVMSLGGTFLALRHISLCLNSLKMLSDTDTNIYICLILLLVMIACTLFQLSAVCAARGTWFLQKRLDDSLSNFKNRHTSIRFLDVWCKYWYVELCYLFFEISRSIIGSHFIFVQLCSISSHDSLLLRTFTLSIVLFLKHFRNTKA